MRRYIVSHADIPWQAEIDGKDILLCNVWATAFGLNDPEDNGITASGIHLSSHPDLMGVALPMDGYGVRVLKGSPIPRMPFGRSSRGINAYGAWVVIEDFLSGKDSPTVPVIELGPALWTGNAIDFTVPLARLFDHTATANNFKRKVNVRIIGGMKFV